MLKGNPKPYGHSVGYGRREGQSVFGEVPVFALTERLPSSLISQMENGCFLCRESSYRRVGKGLKIGKPRSGSV
jgi:hypothetical protein